MAITIHQQPATHSAIGSKTIIVASSTNSGNDGFQYEVRCSPPLIGGESVFLSPPNPHGYLLFEPNQIYKPFMGNNVRLQDWSDTQSVHRISDAVQLLEVPQDSYFLRSGYNLVGISIYESWIIDGVLTRNDASVVSVTFGYYNAYLDLQKGVNYDFMLMIGHNDQDQSRIMSDRDSGTSTWDMAASYDLTDNAIFIPTYESDWGQWCVRQSDGVFLGATQIRLGILPNSGAPVQQVHALSDADTYSNIPFWPANLNASPVVGILKPSNYPNWKAIYFQLLDDTDEIVSKSYVMYNAERDGNCERFDKIRIAWVGRRGGWEYHNFTMKSEESYVTDKVVAQRVIGNYGSTGDGGTMPYAINTFDESEVVVDLKIQKFVTANSDWLTEGEFEFLKGLFLSKQVHWVQDDGSHIPVILEANGYEVKRQFTQGKLYNQQIKFKIAQEQFN